MFSFVVIVIQVLAIIFIGAFARTTTTTLLSTGNITSLISLSLAFALMYTPFKKLSYFSLISVLLTLAIGIQSFLLFGMFWDSCFNGFNSSYQLTSLLLQRGMFCSLAILIVWLDFIAILRYWQIYILISPIFVLGYALNSAIINYGIKAFDGGGGLQIFLYSGVVSAFIWLIVVRGTINAKQHPAQQSYMNRTLGFIGLVIALIAWPQFNSIGGSVSFTNTILTNSTSLNNSGYGNTFLGLAVALITSLLFATQGSDDRLKPQVYISSFVNAGIIISSYSDISLNPVSCMLMTFITTIINLVLYKYLLKKSDSENSLEGQSKIIARIYVKILFRIIYSFVGIIITSIIVATRFNLTPQLLSATDYNVYSKKAGLQIAAFFITLVIGVVFGLIISLVIKIYLKFKQPSQEQRGTKQEINLLSNKGVPLDDDNYFTDLYEEIFPIYHQSKKDIDIDQLNTTRMMRASFLPTQKKNPIEHKTNDPGKQQNKKNDEQKLKKQKQKIKSQVIKQQKKDNVQQPSKKYLQVSPSKVNHHAKGILLMSSNFSKTNNNEKQQKNLSKMKKIQSDVQSYQSRKPDEQKVQDDQHKINIQNSVVRKSRLQQQIIKQIVEQNRSSSKFIIQQDQNQPKLNRKLDFHIQQYRQSQRNRTSQPPQK